MKKTYIQPAVRVAEVHLEEMIAMSLTKVEGNDGDVADVKEESIWEAW